ncbi:MAG TPA: hypothetical protein VHZ09_16065 [Acidobacteriaceae bacterium]|nr:hypothetical protein [Acidobacteriaceae bacterium]
MMRNIGFILVATIGLTVAVKAQTPACSPPPGFVDIPHPALASTDPLVSHTEEITVNRPLAEVLSANSKVSLKDAIHRAGSLPGVSGDYPLSTKPFGTPGSRRLVCLSDHSTLEEQVLESTHTPGSYRFRYVVWNYSTRQARPIEYGIGQFDDTSIPGGRTYIRWTYSFKLKDHEFPGYLGAFGRYLFQVTFLDRQYAEMMRATLRGNNAR